MPMVRPPCQFMRGKPTSENFMLTVIFPPLSQLERGINCLEGRKPKEVCTMRYRRKDESERRNSEIDLEGRKQKRSLVQLMPFNLVAYKFNFNLFRVLHVDSLA